MMESVLRNCWYQAAWSAELTDRPLGRTFLGIPVVLFRSNDSVSALLDRCPHRFAPLSVGTVKDGAIHCNYHGLAFGAAGLCVFNPHGPVTSQMRVAHFPLIERHTALWIWMGQPELADPGLIPDLSFLEEAPAAARVAFHMPTASDYRLMTDNIMDLSHADYLHAGTFGKTIVGAKSRVFKRDGAIVAEWINIGCEAPPFRREQIPGPNAADFWIEVEWRAPGIMALRTATVPTGTERHSKDISRAVHIMTPESERRTHYFACGTGRAGDEDPVSIEARRKALTQAFLAEDKPMLEAQQARMGHADLWELKPLLLPIDAAAVTVRRELDHLILAESSSWTTIESANEERPHLVGQT